MTILTIYALFGDDTRVLTTNKVIKFKKINLCYKNLKIRKVISIFEV